MTSIKHKDLIKELSARGLEFVREGRGSHAVYKIGDKQTTIPHHRVIAPGTRRDIYKLLGLEYGANGLLTKSEA